MVTSISFKRLTPLANLSIYLIRSHQHLSSILLYWRWPPAAVAKNGSENIKENTMQRMFDSSSYYNTTSSIFQESRDRASKGTHVGRTVCIIYLAPFTVKFKTDLSRKKECRTLEDIASHKARHQITQARYRAANKLKLKMESWQYRCVSFIDLLFMLH